MGKSPGKWIKSVLFGKKSSKSSISKNTANEKKTSFAVKATTGESTVESPVISDLPHHTTNRSWETTVLGKCTSANLSGDAVDLLPGNQGTVSEVAGGFNSADLTELAQQEQAAMKAQAAFRGYLARRAFRALKGIIRLQAFIRGHLVRRQAVATLHCMQAILKFQALIRDRHVILSDAGLEDIKNSKQGDSVEPKGLDLSGVDSFRIPEKLSRNGFVIKLIVSSGSFMPLSLQYDVAEPNSVWSWLERWSACRFWEPLTGVKKNAEPKHQKKQRNLQTLERESGRPRRGLQKGPVSNGDSNLLHSTSDHEKSKRHQKKALSYQSESTQEHPQSELERVKRNLRKVSMSAEEASDKLDAVNDKAQRNVRKLLSSLAPDASQQGTNSSPEKLSDPTLAAPEQTVVEPPIKPFEVVEPPVKPLEVVKLPIKPLEVLELPAMPLEMGEPVALHDDQPVVEQHHPSENDNKVLDGPVLSEELHSKEDWNKENQRTRRRRSLPGKQEYLENVSQNTPTLPSYMAATESAKAKLRAQGLSKASQEGAENGFVRRHSLPSSTNGKMSSLSPRVQRPILANGKGGSRSDRSLMSSRDDKLVQQPGWRR